MVYKFGGTSLGSPARMKQVAAIVLNNGGPVMVVLSAVSGTTNALVEIHAAAANADVEEAAQKLSALHAQYDKYVDELLSDTEQHADARAFVTDKFALLQTFQ